MPPVTLFSHTHKFPIKSFSSSLLFSSLHSLLLSRHPDLKTGPNRIVLSWFSWRSKEKEREGKERKGKKSEKRRADEVDKRASDCDILLWWHGYCRNATTWKIIPNKSHTPRTPNFQHRTKLNWRSVVCEQTPDTQTPNTTTPFTNQQHFNTIFHPHTQQTKHVHLSLFSSLFTKENMQKLTRWKGQEFHPDHEKKPHVILHPTLFDYTKHNELQETGISQKNLSSSARHSSLVLPFHFWHDTTQQNSYKMYMIKKWQTCLHFFNPRKTVTHENRAKPNQTKPTTFLSLSILNFHLTQSKN